MATSSSRFEATAAALGYAFQFRHSLARSLEALQAGSYDWCIAIESADDVELVGPGGHELRQLKQVGRPISNASTDLWKTLRIWSERISSGQIDANTTRLYLITTGSLGEGSAPSLLVDDIVQRDEPAAETHLLDVCRTSTNKENQKAYTAFQDLSSTDRRAMLRSIRILPSSDDVSQSRDRIADFLRIGTRREHVEPMLERLEGWWIQQCIVNLTDPDIRISAEAVDSYLSNLRDQFSPNNLPIDFDIVEEPEPDVSQFARRNFVLQAQLALVGNRRLQIAVRDYLRAFAQRSRWARLNLVSTEELQNYERRLIEEWEITFEQLNDALPEAAADSVRSEMARQVYKWAETAEISPIRLHCTEQFIKRGSLHILADELAVGWHPDFLSRLSSLLTEAG